MGRELASVSDPLARENLIINRGKGEFFARSVMNFTAMVYGADVGQPGAQAKVIAKIFTGASWWGAEHGGWQQLDETWLCRDRKNRLGIVTQETGRVLWRVAGDVKPSRVVSNQSKYVVTRRAWVCCSRRVVA